MLIDRRINTNERLYVHIYHTNLTIVAVTWQHGSDTAKNSIQSINQQLLTMEVSNFHNALHIYVSYSNSVIFRHILKNKYELTYMYAFEFSYELR